MVCPKCRKHSLHSRALRRNVKAIGDTDISYDLICPYCQAPMGYMLWGKLTLPEMESALPGQAPLTAPSETETPKANMPEPESPAKRESVAAWQYRRHIPPLLAEDAAKGEGSLPEMDNKRRGERRKQNKPVLYDRRLGGQDRRNQTIRETKRV